MHHVSFSYIGGARSVTSIYGTVGTHNLNLHFILEIVIDDNKTKHRLTLFHFFYKLNEENSFKILILLDILTVYFVSHSLHIATNDDSSRHVLWYLTLQIKQNVTFSLSVLTVQVQQQPRTTFPTLN